MNSDRGGFRSSRWDNDSGRNNIDAGLGWLGAFLLCGLKVQDEVRFGDIFEINQVERFYLILHVCLSKLIFFHLVSVMRAAVETLHTDMITFLELSSDLELETPEKLD